MRVGLAGVGPQGLQSLGRTREFYRSALREAFDLLFKSGLFSISEPNVFEPIRQVLFDKGDHYMHLADLPAYADAQQRIDSLYRNQEEWSRKAILNVACSGKFSSDRTILEYASEIWNVKPCAVDLANHRGDTIVQARR